MREREYPITPKMMKIADNPNDPWLAGFLKSHGTTAFSFGEADPTKVKKEALRPVSLIQVDTPKAKSTDAFGVSQKMLDLVASKVKDVSDKPN